MATMIETPGKKKKKSNVTHIKKSKSHLPRQETVEVTSDMLLSVRMSKLRPVKIRDFPFKGKSGVIYITPFAVDDFDRMREEDADGKTSMNIPKMADVVAENTFTKNGEQLMTSKEWRKVDVPTLDKVVSAISKHANKAGKA